MKVDAFFWLFVALLVAIIAIVAFGSEPPAKPIGRLFVLIAVLIVGGLVVRWWRRRKARKKEEEEEDDEE